MQDAPAVHETQVPAPSQTMFMPQVAPADLEVPSTHVIAPVAHEVMPFLQLFGLPEQVWPAVHPTQPPEPLQTMLVPQLTPGDLLVPSTHAMTPVEQELIPLRQGFELPVQDVPAVHDTQPPAPLQTMLVPQLVPAIFGLPFAHVDMPVEHDAVPLKQTPGLPVQLCPGVHMPQNPCPSQTWLDPQDMPAMTLPVPSTQTAAPVAHEMTPTLQALGLPVHEAPPEHATQLPEALQTMFVPQLVPAALFVSSRQVWTPVVHEVMPSLHAALGFVAHVCPGVHTVHWPFALHTWFTPQPVPAALTAPSTQVCAPVAHDVVPE